MIRRMMTMMVAILAWTGMNAMDYETARERAYYLTDKMAYELNLNDQQYNDAFEINLDYLLSINTEADLRNTAYLTYRNDDLRHILYDWQWAAFAAVDYLFTPLHWLNGGWHFPIFRYYAHDYYFYHRPRIFWDYRGGHGRLYFSHGFYHDRRPLWHGGLRGEHRRMIGHPNPGHRYGNPGHHNGFRPGRNHGSFDAHSGRFENHGGNRHNNGYRSSDRGMSNRPNNGFSSSDRGMSNRPNNGFNNSSRGANMSSSSRGASISSSPRGSSMSGVTRGSSTSRGGSMGGHESRGSRGSGRR